jgi:hypothetical protein
MTGNRYDPVNRCKARMDTTLSCCASPAGSSCTSTDADGCEIDSHGAIWFIATGGPGASCDDATYQQVLLAPSCEL